LFWFHPTEYWVFLEISCKNKSLNKYLSEDRYIVEGLLLIMMGENVSERFM